MVEGLNRLLLKEKKKQTMIYLRVLSTNCFKTSYVPSLGPGYWLWIGTASAHGSREVSSALGLGE
jgi:hypothetical protein